jgi:hypothetical protein
MTKYWAAFVSVLLLLGTPAVAASWSDGFKACDADGSGTINRSEFNACESKLDPQMNPTFTMMDKDANNSVDQDEWASAEKQKMAISHGCKESTSSWCPCQNNPDDPKCQKSN